MSTAAAARDAGFARWLDQAGPRWASEWASAVPVEVGAFEGTPAAELDALAAECVAALKGCLRGGCEAPLAEFCGTLARRGLERGLRVADLARALDLGRTLLVARLTASRVPAKGAAREQVERTFSLALTHLLEAFQREAESRDAAARARLEASEARAARARREWHLLDQILSQHEVQRSLARTRELVRNILDASLNAIISTDTSGCVTLFNRTAERIFAVTETEALGTPVADRYAGGREEAAKVMRLLREQGALRDYETAIVDRHGETVPVRLTASLLRDEAGEVVGTMGFIQDLTVEEALRREVASRDRYLLSILHASTDGLVTVDDLGRIASWNRGATLLFGAGPEEALGRPVEQFLKPEGVRHLPSAADAPPGTERFEYRVEGPSAPRDLLVTRTEIGEEGARGVSYVFKEVSELNRLQQELAEAEHLAELGRLAASIAHEIKNPIAGLRGAMEMMGGVHAQEDPRFAIFREALSQIRRLDALVKDLLAYARPVTLKTEPVPVHLLVDAAALLAKDAIEEGGLTLENGVGEDLPAVRVDPILIQQVLVNLLVNAAQATPSGGRVSVAARAEEGGTVAVVVSDTGCGILPEVRENIFKPFFTTKHVGTGLGLSIVGRLLRAHGGWCDVESAEGEGTTFTVHLPAEGRKG